MTRTQAKKVSNTSVKKPAVKKPVKKDNDTGYVAFLLCAIVLFIIILISTIFSDMMQIYNNRRQTKELQEQYSMLLEEEASLHSEVIKLQDPDYVARYAREKFLYTKDGEKILRIVDGKMVEEEEREGE